MQVLKNQVKNYEVTLALVSGHKLAKSGTENKIKTPSLGVSFANKEIHGWSDNQTAIKALLQPNIDDRLTYPTMEVHENWAKKYKVSLVWVPEHIGIQ